MRAADKAKELLSSPTDGFISSVTDEAKPCFTDDQTGINGPTIEGARSRIFEPAACLPFRDISNLLLSGGPIPTEGPTTDLGAQPGGGPSEGSSQSIASGSVDDDDVTSASCGSSLNKRKSPTDLGLPATDLVAALEGWGVLSEDLREALLLRSKSR